MTRPNHHLRLPSRWVLILGALALIPAGITAHRLLWTMVTGGEELTRWNTVDFANKTGMFFIVVGGLGWLGSVYWERQHSTLGKAVVGVVTLAAVIIAGWVMSQQTPFNVG